MRRVLGLVVLLAALLLSGNAEAQCNGCGIGYWYNGVPATGGTMTGALTLPAGSVSNLALKFPTSGTGFYDFGSGLLGMGSTGTEPFMLIGNTGIIMQDYAAVLWSTNPGGVAADLQIVRDAANTLALKGVTGTTGQTFNVYNSFTTAGSNYGRFSILASATGTDLIGEGAGATATTAGIRSIQGCRSTTLTDNTATALVRVAVADDDLEGIHMIYTAVAEDANGDARQTRTGTVSFAIANNSGTEALVASTGDSAVSVTAGTFTCTFDGNSGAADTIDIRATCNTSLDAAAEILTIQWCLVSPSTVTLTPQ